MNDQQDDAANHNRRKVIRPAPPIPDDGTSDDASDDGSELKDMYVAVKHMFRSGCNISSDEAMRRCALANPMTMDTVMINANETTYCRALQEYQTKTGDVVWHNMAGNRYLWCAKTMDCDTPHFYPFPVTKGRVRVPEWIVRKGETALYCPKHKYGPMDSWYDCQRCVEDHPDSPDAIQALPTRTHKIATILRKIPKKYAERYIQCEAASGMNARMD